QHRSRQSCRDGTPNPLVNNSLPASARWRPVIAWARGGARSHLCERYSGKQDGGNLAAVIVFAMVQRPPIAEQPGFVAISAQVEIGNRADTGPSQPLADIAGEVEMRLARALVGGEEGGAGALIGEEAFDIVGADLIGLPRDGRADH